MPGTVRSLIVGGGIKAGSPSTLLNFPIFSGAFPPDELVDGNIRQDTSVPAKVYIGTDGADPEATVIGGALSNANAGRSIVIGYAAQGSQNGVLTTGLENVIIGDHCVLTNTVGTAAQNVMVGSKMAVTGQGFVNNSVFIGHGISVPSPAGGTSCVVIGANVTLSQGSQDTIVGAYCSVQANNGNTVIGYGHSLSGGASVSDCTLVGLNHQCGSGHNILIGTATYVSPGSGAGDHIIAIGGAVWVSTLSNVAFIGGQTEGITQFIVGSGDQNPNGIKPLCTWRLTDAKGSNRDSTSLTLRVGLGTGTGTPGIISFDTDRAGGSGSTQHGSHTSLELSNSLIAGETDLRLWDVTANILQRVSIGIADSGGVGFRLLRIPN